MNGLARVVLLVLVLSATGSVAFAQQRGFGFAGGLSSTTYSEPGLSIDFRGFALSADFQNALTPNITLNPFFMLAQEDGQDVTVTDGFGTFTLSTELDYQILGAQLRYWVSDAFFVGGQLGHHTVTLKVSEPTLGSSSDTQSEIAIGFAAGAQISPALGVHAQYDMVSIEGSDIASLRLLVSYRMGSN